MNQWRRNRQQSDRRGGQALILMFLVLVALIGVMALTLDFGFVLLARRQMQSGVNTAAKEGLRGKGLPAYDANNEELRRNNARDLLRLTYDDDFDLSANTTTLGAGIDSSLIQGHGFRSTTIGSPNTDLAEDLSNRSAFIYRPDNFELNSTNLDHGDMLAGTYDPAADHSEGSDYTRADFDPTGADFSAFLVRMRRTHNPHGLDEVPGVSSGGGGLPLLLARAGWMRANDNPSNYSIRRDGVAVRSTAISHAAPARAIGVADLTLTPSLIGAAPLAIELAGWNSMTINSNYALDTTNGELTDGTILVTTARRIAPTSVLFVSEILDAVDSSWPAPSPIPDGTTEDFYVPIFQSISSTSGPVTEELFIGFGRLQLSRIGTSLTLRPLTQIVAAENATSLPPIGWRSRLQSQMQANNTAFAALPSEVQNTVLGELIAATFQQSTSIANTDNTLLAPALVRSTP